jgi:hypothetical protein
LIYILLKLLEFFKSFQARQPAPGVSFNIYWKNQKPICFPQMQKCL